jgi:trehalose 6-phosphate synthase
VVVSNRGPLSFALDDDGRPVRAGSGGGLAPTLGPLLAGTGATWVACAMSEADRAAAAQGLMRAEQIDIVTVEPDADTYRLAYDVVSNATLWFVHHLMFDPTRRPRLDRRWAEAWEGYRRFNEAFADQVVTAAAPEATVLVQDYHLTLLPKMVADRRSDLRLVHFSHTPFADPGGLRILPDHARLDMLQGMAAAACGFHTARWRDAFAACCAADAVQVPPTFVSPLASDPDHVRRQAAEAAAGPAAERVRALVGDRRMVLRVDRMEPSKNLLRGFWAFDELLDLHPELRGEVVFVALAYGSRQTLPQYLAYGAEAQQAAQVVNDRWGTDSWTPVVLDVADDLDRSLAALRVYDVLLVNPIRDGLNLVAKEGPLVNHTDGVLVLSREAGSFAELHQAALAVNPFDVSETAQAMAEALAMDSAERSRRAAALRALVAARTPADWLAEQRAAAGS